MELIEFNAGFIDQTGNSVAPVEIGLPPDIPREVRHVITLRQVDSDKTEMTVTEYGYPNREIVELSRAGLIETLDKMAESLASL
jgi:hypothetical protein